MACGSVAGFFGLGLLDGCVGGRVIMRGWIWVLLWVSVCAVVWFAGVGRSKSGFGSLLGLGFEVCLTVAG